MFKLAIKNIIFYKARSITTFLLLFFTTTLFVVFESLLNGSHANILNNSLGIYTGSSQVMTEQYRLDNNFDFLIEDTAELKKDLYSTKLEFLSERLETMALLVSDNSTVPAMVTGIVPKTESQVSSLKRSLIDGRYLLDTDENHIYLGKPLMQRLGVNIGDQISLIGSDINYAFTADNFTIVGNFKTGLFKFDNQSSFVNKSYLDTIMESHNKSSYVVVWTKDINDIEIWVDNWNKHNLVKAYSWKSILSGLVQAMEVDSVFAYIQISILFVINFFVIMVFAFLNISSRTNDIGMLRAIGINKKSITQLLIYEGVLISIVAILSGGMAGSSIAYYFELYPIVIKGISETFKEYGIISDSIPMLVDWFSVSWNMALMFSINALALIIPIRYINKLSPLEAINHV